MRIWLKRRRKEKEDFRKRLQDVCEDLEGKSNNRNGYEVVMKKWGGAAAYKTAEKLSVFCVLNDLIIGKSYFQHKIKFIIIREIPEGKEKSNLRNKRKKNGISGKGYKTLAKIQNINARIGSNRSCYEIVKTL